MFCHNCGAKITEGSAFCHECGTKVSQLDSESQTSDMASTPAEPNGNGVAMPEPEACAEPFQGTTMEESTANSKTDFKTEEPTHQTETSKFEIWWSGCSKLKKILLSIATVSVVGIVLYLLISSLWKAAYLLTIIIAIGDFVYKFYALLTGSKEDKVKAKKALLKLAVVCAILLAIGVAVNPLSGGGDKYVRLVKDGTLNGYPQMTVGEAFDSFLSKPKWESGLSDDNIRFVNVTGKALYRETDVELVVQFFVDEDDGTFQYHACEINDVPQNDLVFWGLLEAIYNN